MADLADTARVLFAFVVSFVCGYAITSYILQRRRRRQWRDRPRLPSFITKD